MPHTCWVGRLVGRAWLWRPKDCPRDVRVDHTGLGGGAYVSVQPSDAWHLPDACMI